MFNTNYDSDLFNLLELPALRAAFRSSLDPSSFFSVQSLKRSFRYPYDIIYNYKDEEHKELINIEIRIALAGFDKENISIKSDTNVLTIDITAPTVNNSNSAIYRTKGISHANDSISFTVIDNFVDVDNLSCKMVNGVLDITIPYRTIVDNSKIHAIE